MLRAVEVVSRALKTVLRTLKSALLSLKSMPLTFAKWIGGLVTVASLLFVTFQYMDGRWKSRIDRSLNLVLTFQEEAQVKARNQIDLADDPVSSIDAVYIESCRDAIHRFVNNRIGPERKGRYNGMGLESEIIYDELPGVVAKKIFDLSDGEGIKTEWGSVASDRGSLLWFEKGTTYEYSWPDMLWKFFHNKDSDKGACLDLLHRYEDSLSKKDFAQNLHALKPFYATVSICATSGVCDSFVACEGFYREVGTFVKDWQKYFELWSAREQNSEYDRLHAFVKHCSSNQEFGRYILREPVSEMLYAQQFTNYCWQTDGQDSGFCGFLRWVTGLGADAVAQVTLTVHHFVEPQAAAHEKFIEPWARRIEEQSDGRIKVQIYPQMALGGAPWELYRQVREGGDVDIVWTLIGYPPSEFRLSEVFELPTVHRGSALATTLAIQDVFDQIAPDYADVHPLLIHVHAGQAIHMVDKPIRSVDDLAGLKIRVPSRTGQMLIEAWKATPVLMSVPELPQALSAGEVDGALTPYEIVLPYRIHELTKQSIEGPNGKRFGTSVFAFLMNKDRYEDLPVDLRAVIDANSRAAIAGEIGKIWDQVEEPGRAAAMDPGRRIIVLDPEAMAEFDQRSKQVTERWLENMKADGIPGGEALRDAATRAVERRSHSNWRLPD